MIGRLIWYAALIVIAAVTTALQFDRHSASVPVMAAIVPEPARGFAQAQIAAKSLRTDTPEDAVEQAKLLVNKRPMPAETLRLLAQAQFAAGQTDEGFLTIQIAAKRGWRDPAAQETMLRLALSAGDETEAAKRYIALFLQNRTEDALLRELGATLFESPESEASLTLIGIVGGSERWPDTFLRRGVRVLPPGVFVGITRKAMAKDAAFSCAALEGILPQLTRKDERAGTRLKAITATQC